MEVEAHPESCYPSQGLNGQGNKHQPQALDIEVAHEIAYLDEVLEANCCDPGVDTTPSPSNGTATTEKHPREVNIDGTGPSVNISNTDTTCHEVIVEGRKQTIFIGHQDNYRKQGGETISPTMTTIKKEARFELRAFQEEKKPSKLFDPCEKEVRVKKVRPSEEMVELERERLELIRGQAVKKNPDMGTKWWNPPQEKSLEEELEPDKLESHRKYEERKQQRRSEFTGGMSQMYAQYSMTFDPNADRDTPELFQSTKEDILVEQMDFSTARKQFLQMEHARQQAAERSQVTAPNSAKPFSRSPDTGEPSNSGPREASMENRYRDGDFTCARAVMTIIKDEKDPLSLQHHSSSLHSPSASLSSCNPKECDSGLDELSLRSLDNSMLDTLSKDFSMSSVSDSGASNETMSASYLGETSLGEYSFPSTPHQGLSEQELEYHAGMLVQSIIQHALMNQNQSQQGEEWQRVPPLQMRHSDRPTYVQMERPTCAPLPQRSSSGGPKIFVQSALSRSLALNPDPVPVRTPVVIPPRPIEPYQAPELPQTLGEKDQFSYFSKYSEAAELRSTAAATRAQETEQSTGPFKLRSRKQRTLSMIEEEIRAAQEREKELKKQRLGSVRSGPDPRANQTGRPKTMTINPRDKHKTNSLPAKLSLSGSLPPTKLTLTSKTAPESTLRYTTGVNHH
ncbi:unnamed protein product, partial [Oncorhynchus mykiss]